MLTAIAAPQQSLTAQPTLSYSLGRHYHQRIRGFRPFSRYPRQLEAAEAFFHRYGGWSVAIGRFLGASRAIVPLVAGMLRMPPQRFYFANITSAAAQTLVFFLPGMVLGASLTLAAEAAWRLAVLGVLLFGALVLAFWLAHQGYRLLAPHAGAWLQALLRWSDLHPTLGRLAHALADPEHPDARALAGFAFLLIAGALVVGAITSLTLLGAPELTLDRAALDLGQSLRDPLADRLMIRLAALGTASTVLPLVLLVFVWLRRHRQIRHGNYWLAAAAFPLVATPLVGALLAVPRPDLGLQLTLPWSFPSGTVLLATCVYGFLAVSIAGGLPERERWAPYALAATTIAGVAAARVYLGAEWLSSVVDSIALGVVWVAALGLACHRHARVGLRGAVLAGVAAAGLMMGLGLHGWIAGDQELARLTPAERTAGIGRAAWHTGDWARLPQYREDWRRHNRQPLTIQYAGDPAALTNDLAAAGWAPALVLDWANAMRLLSPSLPLTQLPVIPQVHAGRQEALTLARSAAPDQREVLRLWPSGFRLNDDGTPLWVGNVSRQRKGVLVDLIAFPATIPNDFDLPTELIGGTGGLAAHTVPGTGILLIEPSASVD